MNTNTAPETEQPDFSIVVRFGNAVLEAGHTSIPNLVLMHYAELGITTGELTFMILCLQHKWSKGNPHPSLSSVARRMGISRRSARTYVAGLRTKGFLTVTERPGAPSVYDFTPLLVAVVKADDGDGGGGRKNSSEGGRKFSSYPIKKDEIQEDELLSSSSRTLVESSGSVIHTAPEPPAAPSPVRSEEKQERRGGSASLAEILLAKRAGGRVPIRIADGTAVPSRSPDYLESGIREISERIGDTGDLAANVARSKRLMRSHGMDEASFMVCAMRAHALLKERSRNGRRAVRRPGAYFFSILEGILEEIARRNREKNGIGTATATDGHFPQKRAS